VLIVSSIGDAQLSRFYALAEAKAAYRNVLGERNGGAREALLLGIGEELGVPVKRLEGGDGTGFEYAVSLRDYLRYATLFHGAEWKLVNKPVRGGLVYLGPRELARLLQEAVRGHIEERAATRVSPEELPELLRERVGAVRSVWERARGFTSRPVGPGKGGPHPPCVRLMMEKMGRREHLSHAERFALTTYLLSSAYSVEDVVELYASSFPDFRRSITLYQVRHLAGLAGSRTKYSPPRCSTLKTQGVCPGGDEVCRLIRHPLRYAAASRRLGGGEGPRHERGEP